MKDPKQIPVIPDDAIASVSANSPQDDARRQISNRDPYRFCTTKHEPHVGNPDNMGKKGGY